MSYPKTFATFFVGGSNSSQCRPHIWKFHICHEKKTSYFPYLSMKYWLFNRDPYNGSS